MTPAPTGLVSEQRRSWWGTRAVLWVREYWSLALTILGAVFGVLIGAPAVIDLVVGGFKWKDLSGGDWFICVMAPIAVSCVIAGPIAEAKKRKSKESLELAIQALEIDNRSLNGRIQASSDRAAGAVDLQLEHLSQLIRPKLRSLLRDMGVWAENCRVSAYRHDAETSEFVKIARESSNPNLMATGRMRYPDNEGLIHRAWENGTCAQDTNFVDEERWVAYQVNRGDMRETTARGLSMKARCYRGVRVRDDVSEDALGVLIFEHESKNGLDSERAAHVLSDMSNRPSFVAIRAYFAAMLPTQFRTESLSMPSVGALPTVPTGASDFISHTHDFEEASGSESRP